MKNRGFRYLTRGMQLANLDDLGELPFKESVRLLPRRRTSDPLIVWDEDANIPTRDEWLSLHDSVDNLRQRARQRGRSNSRRNRHEAVVIERLRHLMARLPDPRRFVYDADRRDLYTHDAFSQTQAIRAMIDLDRHYRHPRATPTQSAGNDQAERPSGTYPVVPARHAA